MADEVQDLDGEDTENVDGEDTEDDPRFIDGRPIVTTEIIAGIRVPVTVDGTGHFRAKVGGRAFYASTLESLLVDVKKRIKELTGRVSVKATLLNLHGGPSVEIEVYGLHNRTGELLYRKLDGSGAGRLAGWAAGRKTLRLLTNVEKAEYERLREERDRAQKAYETFIKPLVIDLGGVVQEALAAGAKE